MWADVLTVKQGAARKARGTPRRFPDWGRSELPTYLSLYSLDVQVKVAKVTLIIACTSEALQSCFSASAVCLFVCLSVCHIVWLCGAPRGTLSIHSTTHSSLQAYIPATTQSTAYIPSRNTTPLHTFRQQHSLLHTFRQHSLAHTFCSVFKGSRIHSHRKHVLEAAKRL